MTRTQDIRADTSATGATPNPAAITYEAGGTQRRWPELLLVLPFLVFYLFQLALHEMWRDELNAWGIAAASPSLKVLYQHVRYEGHPGLWYFLLWLPSRFTTSPIAMKCLQALVGLGIYLFIALRSPFSRWEKLLLYCGYFISFEYTVMSRMYGVGLLLALVYAYRRVSRPEQVTANLLVLALLANTDMTGLILSFGLLVEYAWAVFINRQVAPDTQRIWRAIGVYALGLLLAAAALRISPHISWRTTGRMFQFANQPGHLLQAVVSYIALPWFPIADGFPHHFWNPWVPWGPLLLGRPFLLIVCPIIVTCMVLIFRRDRGVLLSWVVTALGSITFAHLIYMGGTRHYGVTFIAFLAAYWMLRSRRQTSWIALVLLGVSAVAGVQAAIAQRDHAFSHGSSVVKWLRANGLADAPLVGTPDTSVIGIAEQLQRPLYMLDCNCSNTFLLFSVQRDDFDPVQTPQRLKLAAEKLHAADMVFITTYALPGERLQAIRAENFSIELAARFTGAEDWEENYYVYRVRKQ